MNPSTPGLPVHHQLLEFTQTHVHWVGDAIQPSPPLFSPSPPALNLSQYQSLFQWVSSSYQVAKVLALQLQHQSFQWTPRTDLLLDSKEIKPVNSKGNQPWIFIGKTDAEAETPALWPPIAKSGLIEKDHDAGKDWWQEEKGTVEDEMVGWHHRLSGHEFEQTLGDSEGLGSLACCSPWRAKSWHNGVTEKQMINSP